MVVRDCDDYLARGHKQLNDESLYLNVKDCNDKKLSDLEKSKNILKRLNNRKNHFRKGIEVLFV